MLKSIVALIAALQLAAGVHLCQDACMKPHAMMMSRSPPKAAAGTAVASLLTRQITHAKQELIHLAMQSVRMAPPRWAPQWVAILRWWGRACAACKL